MDFLIKFVSVLSFFSMFDLFYTLFLYNIVKDKRVTKHFMTVTAILDVCLWIVSGIVLILLT